MPSIWYEEEWSKGILLGLKPDPNTGYRAYISFEYTRHLFNEIREGSLVAVRNFSDRPPDGGERRQDYEEYSILQIDKVHPWHYAIQYDGQGFPGFAVAAARNASQDWLEMDEENRDDVARIHCEAIPLRLAFRREDSLEASGELPRPFFDRSMPMPGKEVYLLSKEMMEAVLNQGIESDDDAFVVGQHVVQPQVAIRVRRDDLTRLHFGVFGYTGAGKSNLISTLVANILQPSDALERTYRVVLVDLMDEYTGLLIDQLVKHKNSLLVVCGRRTLTEQVYEIVVQIMQAKDRPLLRDDITERLREVTQDWSARLTLPRELKDVADAYARPLATLLWRKQMRFYESEKAQGISFFFSLDSLIHRMGSNAYAQGRGSKEVNEREFARLRGEITPLLVEARNREAEERDAIIEKVMARLRAEQGKVRTGKAREALQNAIDDLRQYMGSRGRLAPEVAITPEDLVVRLNAPVAAPKLVVVIGENEQSIAEFMRQIIEQTFETRRRQSILFPTVSFIFDEADVFIGQQRSEEASLVVQATLLARRGRKFGLGLGIATQRIRYLNTSIMAQPHTYFISKLPRKSDRDAIAEAFAISDETLEQTFSFTVGQWLLVSHDATGLRSVPFPVQLPNANDRVKRWLEVFNQKTLPSPRP